MRQGESVGVDVATSFLSLLRGPHGWTPREKDMSTPGILFLNAQGSGWTAVILGHWPASGLSRHPQRLKRSIQTLSMRENY